MDIEKLRKIYGNSILEIIIDNKEIINSNLDYLDSLGFSCAKEAFNRYPLVFILEEEIFREKINKINVSQLENDLSFLEELL